MTTASFANSDGWIDRPITRSQDREPLMVDAHGQHEHQTRRPTAGRRTAPRSEPTGGRRRRPRRAAPARCTMLTSCLRRYAVESPSVRSTGARWPTTPGGRTTRPARARPSRTQSEAAQATESRDQSPFEPAERPGGRIEPSPRNVGRPAGGVVPGIAEADGVDGRAGDAVQRLPDRADGRPGGARAGAGLRRPSSRPRSSCRRSPPTTSTACRTPRPSRSCRGCAPGRAGSR